MSSLATLQKYSIGTAESVTVNYVCPSDGYINIEVAANSSNACTIVLDEKVSHSVSGNNSYTVHGSLYVRKGMKVTAIYNTGGTVRFRPFT